MNPNEDEEEDEEEPEPEPDATHADEEMRMAEVLRKINENGTNVLWSNHKRATRTMKKKRQLMEEDVAFNHNSGRHCKS